MVSIMFDGSNLPSSVCRCAQLLSQRRSKELGADAGPLHHFENHLTGGITCLLLLNDTKPYVYITMCANMLHHIYDPSEAIGII